MNKNVQLDVYFYVHKVIMITGVSFFSHDYEIHSGKQYSQLHNAT